MAGPEGAEAALRRRSSFAVMAAAVSFCGGSRFPPRTSSSVLANWGYTSLRAPELALACSKMTVLCTRSPAGLRVRTTVRGAGFQESINTTPPCAPSTKWEPNCSSTHSFTSPSLASKADRISARSAHQTPDAALISTSFANVPNWFVKQSISPLWRSVFLALLSVDLAFQNVMSRTRSGQAFKTKNQEGEEDEVKAIVFVDMANKRDDEKYAESIRQAFRSLTRWKVLPETRIWRDLGEFSSYYSKEKRDAAEVAVIFCLAQKIKI